MTERPIHAAWEGFRDLVIPRDAPPHQVGAMRLAFLAGVQALLNDIVATSCRTGATDDDVAELLMTIDAELREFDAGSPAAPAEGARRR